MEESTQTTVAAPSNSTSLDSPFRYVLFPVVYSIIFILGVFENIYILYALWYHGQKIKSELRMYMMHLSIADLLFVCVLPFWIDYYNRHGDWIYGEFFCQMTGSLFFINIYGSILFLGAISLKHYWETRNIRDTNHKKRGIIVCSIIWLLTVSATVGNWFSPATHMDSNNATQCFEGYHKEPHFVKENVAKLHFFVIGCFFVLFFLVLFWNFLFTRFLLFPKDSQSVLGPKKRRALQMVFAVVGIFILCFLPHHIVQGPWTLAVLNIEHGWGHMDWKENTRQAINDAHQVTLALMGLSCILDPVVYYFSTEEFEKLVKKHIKKFTKREGCSSTLVSIESRDQSQKLQSIHQQSTQE